MSNKQCPREVSDAASLWTGCGIVLTVLVLLPAFVVILGALGLYSVEQLSGAVALVKWPMGFVLTVLLFVGVLGATAGVKFYAGQEWARMALLLLTAGILGPPVVYFTGAAILAVFTPSLVGADSHGGQSLNATMVILCLGGLLFVGRLIWLLAGRPARNHTGATARLEGDRSEAEKHKQTQKRTSSGHGMPTCLRLALAVYAGWGVFLFAGLFFMTFFALGPPGEASVLGLILLLTMLPIFGLHVFAIVQLRWRMRSIPALVAWGHLLLGVFVMTSWTAGAGGSHAMPWMGLSGILLLALSVPLLVFIYIPRSSRAWFGQLQESQDVD